MMSEVERDGGYRYGFQGMEQDNEVSGNGNSYTTQFRQYDPRLGRWKSLDPLMASFPHMSPFVAFDNNPIYYTDPYGLSSDGPGDEKKKGEDDEVPVGQQKKDGTWNGEQNVEEVTVTYDRASGKVIPPPEPKKVGNYSMTVLINGTEFKKDKLDYNTAHDFQSDFYNQLNELRARQLNNKSGWAPLAGPVYDTKVGSIAPDAISFDIELSGEAGTGVDAELSIIWILKGQNASFKPVIVLTTTVGYGYDVGATVGLSAYNKGFGDILRSDFETPLNTPFLNRGVKTSFSGSFLGQLGVDYTYTPLPNGNFINNYGLSVGASVTPGPNYTQGIPTSIILWGR